MAPYDEDDMRRAEEIARKAARDAEIKRQEEAARNAEQEKRKN